MKEKHKQVKPCGVKSAREKFEKRLELRWKSNELSLNKQEKEEKRKQAGFGRRGIHLKTRSKAIPEGRKHCHPGVLQEATARN